MTDYGDSKMTAITLYKDEIIIAVVPEVAEGPGWQNHLVWVYICNTKTNEVRTESIQKDEMTDEIRMLFDIGEVVCRKLKKAVLKNCKLENNE